MSRPSNIEEAFPRGLLRPELFIGVLSSVSAQAVRFNLKTYLESQHIWVSKTGMGIGFGMNPDRGGMGQIDAALERIGQRRRITIYTRHYQMPALVAHKADLIATLPTRIARLQNDHPQLVVKEPPFFIPEFELKMAWGALLHHSPAHRWLRQLILYVARQITDQEQRDEEKANWVPKRRKRIDRE